jgi:hypothetical protein
MSPLDFGNWALGFRHWDFHPGNDYRHFPRSRCICHITAKNDTATRIIATNCSHRLLTKPVREKSPEVAKKAATAKAPALDIAALGSSDAFDQAILTPLIAQNAITAENKKNASATTRKPPEGIGPGAIALCPQRVKNDANPQFTFCNRCFQT